MSNFYGDGTDNYDAKFAYKVGLGMEVPFSNVWSLQTGLNFVSKGCKYTDNAKANSLYLELPVMAGARINTASGFDVLFKAGPYLAYGVGGKTKATVSNIEANVDTFGDNGLDKFDAGLGCGVGFEFSQIVIGLEGQFGLTKVQSATNYAPKNIAAFLTLGYKF